MHTIIKKIFAISLICICMCACVSCKKEETQTEETTEAITNGSVEDSSAFIPLGMVIDVSQNDMIKDVTYEIKDTEIAVVNFIYNGLQCQFRGSAVHNEFDLAGVRLRSGRAGVADHRGLQLGHYGAVHHHADPAHRVRRGGHRHGRRALLPAAECAVADGADFFHCGAGAVLYSAGDDAFLVGVAGAGDINWRKI